MKTLSFSRAHDLAQLHNELLAAVPALAGTFLRDDGAEEPKLRVEGIGTTVHLTVPDDADERAIAAVVDAHEPKPAPESGPTRDERLLAAVDQAKEAVTTSGQFTQAQAAVLSAVFDGLGQAITGGGSS